jgi:uncharacterized protein (TIGR03067 family)
MKTISLIRSATILVIVLATTAARAVEPENPTTPDEGFKPEQLLGAWKLISGEKVAKPMAKESTGGIFVFTKDTLIGKNRFGDELSGMTYTLDTSKKPVVMKLTITKNFPGVTADAIVEIRDGKLLLCYGKEPTSFVTKEGENNRSMVFVKSVDPAEIQGEIKALSEKRWASLSEGKLQILVNLCLDSRFTLTTGDGKQLALTKDFFEFTKLWDSKANGLDRIDVTDRSYTILSDTAIETGRAEATKAGRKDAVWVVRYTTTWARDDGKWYLVGEHQSPAK